MRIPLLVLGVWVLSIVLTGWLRGYALRTRLLDMPNARSSHSRPTPRGGGMAIVAGFVLGLLACRWLGAVSDDLLAALLGGGLAIAAVGYIDDRRGVPVRWRLAVHVAAAAWALWWLGPPPALPLPGGEWRLELLGYPLALLLIVWLLNLYNFMDGIDGIAGVETVTVAGGAAVLAMLAGDGAAALPLLLLAAAAAGFLLWNWPPAKIFMGDVGSAFIGFVLAAFALGGEGPLNPWVWPILLGVFLVDASYTLLRRLLRGEAIHQVHRSHAYQRASRRLGAHRPVTVAVAAINLCWLWPLAWIALRHPELGPLLTLTAWAPLVGLAIALGAGERDEVVGASA